MRKRTAAQKKARNNSLEPFYWPTLNELRAATRAETLSTVRQIIYGQAFYFGYECETYADNEIRDLDLDAYDKLNAHHNKPRTNSKKVNLDQMIRMAERAVQKRSILEGIRGPVRQIVRYTARFLKISEEEAFTQLKSKGCV